MSGQSKREQKPCENCSKPFGRQVYKGGIVQSAKGFQLRRFCSQTCAAIVRNRNAKKARA
jgi:hypothetical protein